MIMRCNHALYYDDVDKDQVFMNLITISTTKLFKTGVSPINWAMLE